MSAAQFDRVQAESRGALAGKGRNALAAESRSALAGGGRNALASGQPLRIGALLPLTGDLAEVGRLLREGIELALDRHRSGPSRRDIELVVRDAGAGVVSVTELVRSLEEEGVVAIIGPSDSESLAEAARARRDSRLTVISPLADEALAPAPASYALDARATRESDVARDLARWMIEELGLRRAGVLEPLEARPNVAARAFVEAVRALGGEVVGRQRYDPSLTTFRDPIEALAASEPDVVFAPSRSAPGVLSVAPQLFYYGLYDVLVMGDEAWGDPAALRRLEGFATDHRVVGMTNDRVSAGTPWRTFALAYERKYRKPLRDNQIPALAHDATLLALAGLGAAGAESGSMVAALSAHLATGPVVDGVTGRLRPEASTSVVRRETQIRMLIDGVPVPADRGDLLAWLSEVRRAPSPFAPRDTSRVDVGRLGALSMAPAPSRTFGRPALGGAR